METRSKTSRGFTLIELLVVISVIGILSTVILASINSARARGRDNYRKQSIIQLRTALEIYFNTSGVYPSTSGSWYTSDPNGDLGISYNGGNWIPGLVASGAIARLPQDPLGGLGFPAAPCNGNYHRAFLYSSTNGTGYKLLSHCAPEGTMSASDTFYDTIRPTHAWQVCAGSDCSL